MGECFVQCQTSLADSPELRVKSAVKQLAVPISRDGFSKNAECGATSDCQPCPAAVWETQIGSLQLRNQGPKGLTRGLTRPSDRLQQS